MKGLSFTYKAESVGFVKVDILHVHVRRRMLFFELNALSGSKEELFCIVYVTFDSAKEEYTLNDFMADNHEAYTEEEFNLAKKLFKGLKIHQYIESTNE